MIEENFHKNLTLPGITADSQNVLTPKIPKMIGPYKIESLLEKGGMSILYLGTHPETKDPVTIKVLSPKYVSHPEVVQRFLNEAEIIGMANHPNIVQLYGHGEWEGGLYIAMSFIEGVSLRQYLLQTPMSLRRALEIIIDIAYALCHLHIHGVIHRDLKPENVIITETGDVKVIDFGIAQLLTERESSDSPAKQQLVGTPIYMSPEQRNHPDTVSYPSDIYSLGIIMYELILGKLSHGQLHLSLMPRGVQKILHKSLQPEAKDRYQDVVDFIAEVSAYMNSPAIQKERKVGDPLSELSESLRRAQMALVTSIPPNWPCAEIGLAVHQGIHISGIYYDFFEIPEGGYGIIMGEATDKGAEGIIYTAVLRGMVRSLAQQTAKPIELVSKLNEILFRDMMNELFTLNYLVLNPIENQLHYISCGFGNLWKVKAGEDTPQKISSNNLALGIAPDTEFHEVCEPWHIGDTLILNTLAALSAEKGSEFSENLFQKALKENATRTPQKQVEGIFRKVRIAAYKLFQERSFSLISIKRKE